MAKSRTSDAVRRALETVAFGALLMGMGQTARAAEAAAAATASDANGATALGEVIVTAQKRSENIQQTAIAVSAFTGSQIAQAGLHGPQELQFNVPSLVYGQQSGLTLISLRGIGSDIAGSAGGQTAVGIYLDGLYTGGLISAAIPAFDLERIEVLRGPQGTLYGRNATGGVINYITTPPSFQPGGYASASYGNYNTTEDNLGITGPIIPDMVAGRLSAHFGYHDGFRYNIFRNDYEDADQVYNVTGAILIKPTSDLSITMRGSVTHDNASGPPYELITQETVSGGVSQAFPLGIFSVPAAQLPAGTLSPSDVASLNGGSIASHFGLIQPGPTAPDPNTSLDFAAYQRSKFVNDANSGSVTIDWNPGSVDFKSITGYLYSSLYWLSDSGGDSVPEVDYTPGYAHSNQFTQEFDISGKAFGNRLSWLVGAYYLYDNSSFAATIYLPADGQYFTALHSFSNPPGSPYAFSLAPGYDANYFTTIRDIYSTAVAPAYNFPANLPAVIPFQTIPSTAFLGFLATQTSQSIAGFFQATYSITNTLRVTGGFRYTDDHTSVVRTLHSNFVNTLFGLAPDGSSLAADVGSLCNQVPDSHTWSAPTGTIGVDYDAAAHVLTYAKVSWGYKSGGYNVGECSGAFDPEYLTDYEGGVKAIFADGQILTNLAMYYYDYKNIQFTTYVENASVISNAGSATAFGVELEYAAQPRLLPGFQLDGFVSYEDSHYGPGCFQDPAFILQPAPTKGQTDCANPMEQIRGNELIRAPMWKTLAGAQYTAAFSNGSSLMVRGEGSWTDTIYNDIFNGNAPFIGASTQPSYWIVNARLVWTSANKRYAAELYGQNLSNSLYATNRVAFNTPSTVENVSGQFAPPRTFGVRVTVKFGSAIH